MRSDFSAAITQIVTLLACASVASCGWLDTATSQSGDFRPDGPDITIKPDGGSHRDIVQPPSHTLVLSLRTDIGAPIEGISATHSALGSPCPHLLGLVRAFNGTSAAALLTVTVGPSGAVVAIGPTAREIQPGKTDNLRIEFDCSTNDSVTDTIEVRFANAVDSKSVEYSAEVTIIDAPTGDCDNVADLKAIAKVKSPMSKLSTAASAACTSSGAVGDTAWATCTRTGLVAKAQVSAVCASCYVAAMGCWETRCAAACDGAPGDCAKCSAEEGCVDEFNACAGLNPLSACKGTPCDVETASACVGDDLAVYQGAGTCYDSLGSPACYYPVGVETACDSGFPCVDGVCPADPTLYAFAPTASYVATARVAPEGVGMDLDGDGQADNGLAPLLAVLGQFLDVDPSQVIQADIDAGALALLLEFPNLSDLNASPAQTVNGLTGRALDTASLSGAGLGRFEVDFARSFSLSTGVPASSLEGEIVGGELRVGPGPGPMGFRATGALSLGPNGVGPDIDIGLAGGLLSVVDFASMLNAGFADCDCLGLPLGVPHIAAIAESPKTMRLACSTAFATAVPWCHEGTDAPTCVALAENRSLFCPALGILPFDQDSDGDGQKDAVSFAFEFTAVSATIVGGY